MIVNQQLLINIICMVIFLLYSLASSNCYGSSIDWILVLTVLTYVNTLDIMSTTPIKFIYRP